MRAGGGGVYFQYHRIHSDCAFERHRSKLWQSCNGSRHDDYGVCVDCCAPIAAADADDEKHRTAQIIADAVCTVCAVSRAVVFFLELQHPLGQPYRDCADTRGLLVDYGFFGGTACAHRQNQSGFLSTGTVLAMVLGIPLGRVVGQYFGWQLSFLLIGVCAAGVMLVLAKNLPALPSQNTGSLSSLPSLFKRRNLMLLYAMTVLIITAHFTAYSYIEPFVLQVGGFKAEQVTIVLSLYGLAGFAASYLFGKWFAKSQRLFMLGAVAVILLSALLLLPFASFPYAVYALVFIWGVAIVIVSLGMVSKVLAFASDATDVANSIYSGLYNVGIGGGALLGHYVTVWFGLSNIGIAGALLAAAGLAVCGLLFKEQDNLTQNV